MNAVTTVKRINNGIYRVTLANGAEATVSRDNACDGDTGTGRWQWDDVSGGTSGHATKREAIETFREYRSDPTLSINILAPEADMTTEPVSEYAEAGYWFARDGKLWIVGHGTGSDSIVISRDHTSKANARKAMISESVADRAANLGAT